MKKLLLSMAITAGFAGSALAADMAPRTPIYKAPAPIAQTWTGCWIGAGGGYSMYNVEHSQRVTATGAGFTINQTTGGRGWLATGAVGCDYQFNDRWVVGVFGDFDWTNARGDYGTFLGGAPVVGTLKQTWSWAAGARVGYLVTPSLLTYLNGGFTQAHFNAVDLTTLAGGATGIQTEAQTFNGFFIGSGVEYAVDFLPGLFWKTEARAAYYQKKDVVATCVGVVAVSCPVVGATFGVTDTREPTVYSVRSQLVYRFNWGGPVVARY